jgi:phosphohistidine phosphatase
MKRLILMRHAKTEPWYQGGDDESRALLPRGKSDAACVAAELKGRGWLPDLVLISSARRTRETWVAMKDFFPGTKRQIFEDLYLAGTSTLEQMIQAYAASQTLMLIGHNPGMHDLAAGLSSRAGARHQKAAMALASKMPTSAAALFETHTPGPFQTDMFRLQDYIIAKKLRPQQVTE